MTTPIFHARVSDDGELLQLEPSERQRRRDYLRFLAGKTVEIVIRRPHVQRSRDQNAYIHAVPIPILAAEFGYTIPEMKFVLMGACFGWKTVAGHEMPIKAHTSEMTVEECTQFIEWIVPWAMVNHGITIPLPHEVAA